MTASDIRDLFIPLANYIVLNYKTIIPLYLSGSLVLVLTALFFSIKSRDNGTLYITKSSPFYYIRFISYLILLLPIDGLKTIKAARERASIPVSLCVSFWTTVVSFSVILLPSLIVGSLILGSTLFVMIFLWGLRKLNWLIATPCEYIYKKLTKPKKKESEANLQPKLPDLNDLNVRTYAPLYIIEDETKRIQTLCSEIYYALGRYEREQPDKYPWTLIWIVDKIKESNKILKTKKKQISESLFLDTFFTQDLVTNGGDKWIPEPCIDYSLNSYEVSLLKILLGPKQYQKLYSKVCIMSEQKQYKLTQKQLDEVVEEEIEELYDTRVKEHAKEYSREEDWDEPDYVPRPKLYELDAGDLSIRVFYSDYGQKIIKKFYKVLKPYLVEAYINVYTRNKKELDRMSRTVEKYIKEQKKQRIEQEAIKKIKQKEEEAIATAKYEANTRKWEKKLQRREKLRTIYKTIKGLICPTILVEK
jgi:regulator of replication initiation timing